MTLLAEHSGDYVATCVSVFVGALVTFLVAKWQLKKSGRELRTVSTQLVTQSRELHFTFEKGTKAIGAQTKMIELSNQQLLQQLDTFKQEAGTMLTKLDTAVELVRTESREGLENLGEFSRRLGEQIVNIEESTRKLLNDFPDIFNKAEKLVRESTRRLWVMNFTPCFGRIHAYNADYIRTFAKGTVSDNDLRSHHRTLTARVAEFVSMLTTKSETIEDFRMATVHPDDFGHVFVDPVLAKMEGLLFGDNKEHLRDSLCSDERECVNAIQRRLANGASGKRQGIVFLDKVPLQMFIGAGDETEQCVVFFLGTDNIQVQNAVKGFSTAYPQLVGLFKSVFESTIAHHQRKVDANSSRSGVGR